MVMNLAIIYESQKEHEREAAALQRAVAAAPWLYEPLHRLVSFYRRQDQPQLALNLLREHSAHFAERAEFQRDLEQTYAASGNTNAAPSTQRPFPR